MSVGDLPQRQYVNWASVVLAVEPEYAFDIPHDRWQADQSRDFILEASSTHSSLYSRARSRIQTLFCLGAMGTTALGHLHQKFIFTRHTRLYAALEFVAATSTIRQAKGAASAWRPRMPLLVLLTVTFLYDLACRRLSLVFQWAFMIGFAGALPIVWMTYQRPPLTWKRRTTKLLVSIIGYACFSATTVMFLKART